MTQAQWDAGRPRLTRDNERVIDVWQFCGGWNPALLPLACAYCDVRGVDYLIAALQALRDYMAARDASPAEAV